MKLTMAFLLSCLSTSTFAAELTITIYDRAQLNSEVTSETIATLRSIFRQSGIDIALQIGVDGSEEGRLVYQYTRPINTQTFLVACRHARRDIALEIISKAPNAFGPNVLGTASPLARAGLNVTVFDDRIQATAFRENRSHSLVLAHSIAHEIGHVLLRTPDHTSWGIMSSRWSDQEYSRMHTTGLPFTKAQSKRISSMLSGQGCMDK